MVRIVMHFPVKRIRVPPAGQIAARAMVGIVTPGNLQH
jgi:hypothetical protein